MLRAGLLGVVVTVAEVVLSYAGDTPAHDVVQVVVVALGLGAAVVLSRVVPLGGVALLLAIELGAIASGASVATDELAVALVMYQCARHGGTVTLWVSGFLVPAAYLLSGAFLANAGTDAAQRIDDSGLTDDPVAIALLVLTIALPLAVPWLLGFGLRWRARAERSRHALVVARAEAQAQEKQAQLARDVHDVVGHSLVVIIRQADLIRFLPEDTPPAVLEVVTSIAASARASLTEVRHVLASGAVQPVSSDLDDLIARIPALVATVDDQVFGTPRPLPPTVSSVALRVLQEMLTNALKHGDGHQVEVVRDWRDGLRFSVRNPSADPVQADGMGLSGMRQRLLAVDGTLVVQRDQGHFTVEAHIPTPQATS
jgi:signal transduction histidine kinase